MVCTILNTSYADDNMKKITLTLFSMVVAVALYSQTRFPAINQAIAEGSFTLAQEQIKTALKEQELPDTAVYNLQLQAALLDRIKLDFNRDEAYIRQTLRPYYPDLDEAQLKAWETSGELEMKMIEGEKRYFRNAVWNLFRVNEAAKTRRMEVDGPRDQSLEYFLASYLPDALAQIRNSDSQLSSPKTITIHYTLSVRPDVVPAGEVIRAWLPYPRNSRARLGNIRLDSCSEQNYILSPLSYPHRSIYMEKRAQAGEWTIFNFQASYEAADTWTSLLDRTVLPYDTSSSFYQAYTQERAQHIRFTPAIQELAHKLTADTEDPVQKAWRIFNWIGENIPWASALEYSTMPNIPAYCLGNRRGDCGMKALTFITLCRAAGVPAKWQSGWFLYPDNINLHDWAEVYFEGIGWVPVDPDFNLQQTGDETADRFFFGGADAYRLIVNDDFSGPFFPAKIYPRSETVDFQRGEVEWRGGNLYFNQWRYDMEVSYRQN